MQVFESFSRTQPGFKPFGFSAKFNAQALYAQILSKKFDQTKTHEVLFSKLNNSEFFFFNQKFKLKKL